MGLAEKWDITDELWDRSWSLLSVGEAQRLSLAIANGLDRAEVLMLDGACFVCYGNAFSAFIYPLPRGLFTKEPTSGLDDRLSKVVEDTLIDEVKDQNKALKAIIWITHSEEQAERVGTRFMRLSSGGIEEVFRREP
jgi:ABC-type phosphate transport system ATPase subunit